MCTSLTFKSENGNNFLARTMDFAFELGGKPVVIPRNHKIKFELEKNFKTTYGFVGTGKNLGKFIIADGVNEKGLAMAELYFVNEAVYSQTPILNKMNLAPQEFIMWVLGSIGSVQELKERIESINLVSLELELLSKVVPLHYIVTDKSGDTAVIETNSGKLEIKDNPVGVMTNSPELEWHLKNLNNYLSLRPTNFSNQVMGEYEAKPFGQGSGTFGLPGGYTSPERFVRTVYQRQFSRKGKNSEETTNNIFHILNGVTIPKGVNIKEDGSEDYTQYRAVFNVDELTYYFNPYGTQNVFSVNLTEDLLNAEQPIAFEVNVGFEAKILH